MTAHTLAGDTARLKQRSALRCAIHATHGLLQSVKVVREND